VKGRHKTKIERWKWKCVKVKHLFVFSSFYFLCFFLKEYHYLFIYLLSSSSFTFLSIYKFCSVCKLIFFKDKIMCISLHIFCMIINIKTMISSNLWFFQSLLYPQNINFMLKIIRKVSTKIHLSFVFYLTQMVAQLFLFWFFNFFFMQFWFFNLFFYKFFFYLQRFFFILTSFTIGNHIWTLLNIKCGNPFLVEILRIWCLFTVIFLYVFKLFRF
jgi:hypothetical protein